MGGTVRGVCGGEIQVVDMCRSMCECRHELPEVRAELVMIPACVGLQGICSDVLRDVGQRKLEARMAARR